MIDATALPSMFLAYVGLVAAVVAGLLARAFQGRAREGAMLGLVIWLAYVGAFSGLGWLRDPGLRPPGMLLLVAPVFTALVLIVGVLPTGKRLAAALPLAALIGFQVFRVGVELALSELHAQGLAPRLLTLAGGNVEILIGLSAPLIAWLATRGTRGRRIALLWNGLGLLSLINVAARAVLSAPGPLNLLHTEVPNVAFGFFPYGFIPGFMAPLAFATHMLTFRVLRSAARQP
ncbi:MAG TPA: hypothetical protein VGM81_05615 [Burkholderiaceae bacterium]|jgi:hypothetical protein